MEGLEKEVHRLTEKVGNDSNSQQARNQQLVVKIEEAFAQRLANDACSTNEAASIRLTDFRGLKQGNTKIISFPENDILNKTPFCKLANFSKLEYDIGTHIRCMKFSMCDPISKVATNSDKAGGFSLDKNKNIDCDIGKIEIQTLSNDGKVGRIAFYDRKDKLIVEIKGSYGLNGDKQVTILAENEKLAGFEIYANEYVVMGAQFKIAKCN